MEPAALQILFAARLRRHLGHRSGRYVGSYALHFMVDGHARVAFGDEVHELHGDWVWTGYPGPSISFAPSGALPRLHWRAALAGGLLERWLAEGLWPRHPVAVVDALALGDRADALLRLLQGEKPLDSRRRANALESFLLELQAQQRHGTPLPSWVLDVQRRLQRDWRGPVDYAALAARVHMPLASFRRGFRLATGVAIHTWLLRERHRQVRRELLADDADLDAVAERCGYADLGFFSRQFKRFAGVSPAAFRRDAYG